MTDGVKVASLAASLQPRQLWPRFVYAK